MTIELLYVADPTRWDPTLGDAIRREVDAGWVVVVQTVSGAVLLLANSDVGNGGVATHGIRTNPSDPLVTDGLPLLMGRIAATSCGVWAPTGYHSSRPVTVHAVEAYGHVADAREQWREQLRALAADDPDPHAWLRHVPHGHPADPCPVNHCVIHTVL